VVTDPKQADAIFTDQIGKSFEQKLDDLYGQKPKDKDAENKDGSSESSRVVSSSSRGKGAIFLVDRKTRSVVWSTYERPKSSNSDELNHVAEKIAQRLEKDRKGK
jgi:hypothetical protein